MLTRARFEVFLDGAGPSPEGVPRDLLGVALIGAGAVGSATMFDVECVLSREGRPVTRISAGRAGADLRTGNVSFRDFRMARIGTSRLLRTARAEWRAAERRFVVRGEFDLDGAEPRHGRGLEVNVELSGVGPP